MAPAGSAQREPSMEEILASIRRIIEDSDTVRPPEADDGPDAAGHVQPPAGHEGVQVEVEAFRAGFDDDDQAGAQPAAAAGGDVRPDLHPVQRPVQTAEIRPIRSELAAAEPARPVDAAGETEEIAPAAGSAIISDSTGRQVAAAFGELSEAFAASRRRSFDDMAQEMLRPMLQEWLDNNLPTLVEKLVREEIERVARGG